MRENESTFTSQAAEAKGANHSNSNTFPSESFYNFVKKRKTESCTGFMSSTISKGKKYPLRHIPGKKSREVEKKQVIPKITSQTRSSGGQSLGSERNSNLKCVSAVNDTDQAVSNLDKELVVALKKYPKAIKFNGLELFGLKTELEYLRCKQAVVCLHDCLKVRKCYNGLNKELSNQGYLFEMKQGGARSPKRQSPVSGSITTSGTQDSSFIRTTYTKHSKETIIDGKSATDIKVKCSENQDDFGPDLPESSESPKMKKKVNVAMKKDAGRQEQAKINKKQNKMSHGDSVVSETVNAKTKSKIVDPGQGDIGRSKDKTEIMITNSPKKRGRKPKSAESMQSTEEMKISGYNQGGEANSTPDIVVTPSKDDRKTSKSPRSRKKKGENENSSNTSKEVTSGDEKLVVNKKSRLSSESPSPGRRKRSPKLLLEGKESPKSKKKGMDKKSKTDKVEIECDIRSDNDETNQDIMDINESHVDEVIDEVVNRNVEMLNKLSSKKSPSKKNRKSESPEKKMVSPTREKKSPRKNSQDIETCSSEKKKPRSRSNSTSPKKEKKKVESVTGASDDSTSPVKRLDFDDRITKVIREKSKLPFPSDFQYKYTSSTMGCLGLNDLISKVDSLVKNKDDNLIALFGKVETEDYSEEHSSYSNDTDINTSTDSEKTIIEFDDYQGNTSKESGISDGKDSVENPDSSFDDNKNGTPEELEEEKSSKSMSHESSIDFIDKTENSDVKNDDDEKVDKVSKALNSEHGNSENELHTESKMAKVSDKKSSVVEDLKGNFETVTVFEMFGLTLKKPKMNDNDDKEEKAGATVASDMRKENNENDQQDNGKTFTKAEDDEDVMFVSESKLDDSIVILSDDEEEDKRVDRSGFESVKETIGEKKIKPKLTTINNVVEPKPLDILYKLERADSKKENAFTCNELDEYLDINKENLGPVKNTHISYTERNGKNDKEIDIKEELKKAEPDIDEVGGHVFICFASESALNAHVSLEKKTDWLTEIQLRKMAHLKHMKERQHDLGSKRLTDIKCGDEQKQNFRGIPMRLMKYQKLLKQELEDMLLGRQPRSPEKSPSKTPTKTLDIRKIKGWKKKFHNPEEIQEATRLNISESGKVHWKTEERLVKNLDPEEIKDIGLDLKKKRRKLVNYSNKRKSGNEEKEAEMMEYEYEIDDMAIIESDVYNEDDDKPPPEKIPYYLKYSSQHKYGARKLFVKRMKLDAEDERILQQLGTQKPIGPKREKRKKGRQMFSLCKLTHTMAVAAVSAFDKNLFKRAKGMDKTDSIKKTTKRESRSARKESKTAATSESPEIKEEVDPDYYFDNEDDYLNAEVETEREEHVEETEESIKEKQDDGNCDNESDSQERKHLARRRHSSACRGRNSRRNSVTKSEDNFPEEMKVEIKKETMDTCTEPGPIIIQSPSPCKDNYLGCRYGCICHLCKLSDSGEEKETDFKPPCDKEYCRLGCICDSIDTKSAETEHCRKPGCMFKCKCPPKQPKPDIPREREHGKKKRGRGAKKKKRSPEKPESENSGKEEDAPLCDDNDWEPPNKRKRAPTNSRFANLPKRETTYRLAKNLDAVSRKAMEVYASSEMFTEQKMRKRKSDPAYDDSYYMSPEFKEHQERRRSLKQDGKLEPRLNEETGVLEISDEESDGEVFPEGLESCSRIQPYSGPYKQKKDLSQLNKRKGGTGSKKLSNTVIDLVDSDKEDNSGDNKNKSDLPSSSTGLPPQSLTEKMGLTNRLLKKAPEQKKNNHQDKTADTKWKTQMVCLKAKKKSDDKSQDPQSEIKLLEIMSNCNWEIDRTNMLSKISHIISKEYMCDSAKSTFIPWGAYLLEFLPKADKPAIIPPELKSKLPSEMFSIRIKVTNYINKDDKAQKADGSVDVVDVDREDSKSIEASEEEKKKMNMKLQKKLIDKIKFAERLRTQLILEEQKGVTTSKFSVSREGIEKALKKYKTQLWKAYTGSSNFTIQQLKQALHAAKSSRASKQGQSNKPVAEDISSKVNPAATSTFERIQTNQGVTIVTSSGQSSNSHSFINLANLQQEELSSSSAPVTSVGNIVIHGHNSKHNQGKPNQGNGFIDNIENVKKFECSTVPSVQKAPVLSQGLPKVPIPKLSQSSSTNAPAPEVVIMPLDKNIHPSQLPPGTKVSLHTSQLPPGAKVTFMQPVLNRDGSPIPFSTAAQHSIGGTPVRTVVLPNTTQMSGFSVVKPLINPITTSLQSTQPGNIVNLQSPNMSFIPKGTVGSNQRMPVPATSMNDVFVNGTSPIFGPAVQIPQYVTSVTVPCSTALPGLPLKNISNFGPVVSSDNTSVTFTVSNGATISPSTSSICPIKFNSDTLGNFNYGIPRNDMIGMPPVASMPFKVVPDKQGKKLLLVPVTTTVMPCSAGTNSSGKDVINLQCGNFPVAGPPLSRQNSTSPLLVAVPVADGSVPLTNKEQEVLTYSAQIKTKDTSDIKQNSNVNNEENGLCKPVSVSEAVISKVEKIGLDKTEVLNKSNSGNFYLKKESDPDCGNKDSFASSTKCLSSNCTALKSNTDVLDCKSEKYSGEKIKVNNKIKDKTDTTDSIELIDALDMAKNAGIEIANTLELMNKSDKDVGHCTQSKETNQAIKNDSKTISESVVLVESDEECLLIDEHKEVSAREKSNDGDSTLSGKTVSENEAENNRKSPDVEKIDWEQEIQIMEDYMKSEKNGRSRSKSEENEAIKIEESEESDVDVTSCDNFESCGDLPVSQDPSSRIVIPSGNKRKSQPTMMSIDDLQIKRCRLSREYGLSPNLFKGKNKKIKKEQYRRIELRELFSYIERVVFKYNTALQGYCGRIPRQNILQEALRLLSALNQRQELLMECIEDGQQYERTLEAQLRKQIDSFVDSGVPEAIIRNFLKSVEKSVLIDTKRKKKAEQRDMSEMEENDSVLEFKPLGLGHFLELPAPESMSPPREMPETNSITMNDCIIVNDNNVNSNLKSTGIKIVRSDKEKNQQKSETNSLTVDDCLIVSDKNVNSNIKSTDMKIVRSDKERNQQKCETNSWNVDDCLIVNDKSVNLNLKSVKIVRSDKDGNEQISYINVLDKEKDDCCVNAVTSSVLYNSNTCHRSENAEMKDNIGVENVGVSSKIHFNDNIGCSSASKNVSSTCDTNINSIQSSFEPITIEDSPEKNVQPFHFSVTRTITPCQKSASDEDEVRSSTGDALIDLDGDFINSDNLVEAGKSEIPKQIDSVVL